MSKIFMPETLNLTQALDIFSDQHSDIRKACIENVHAINAEYSPYKKMEDDDEFTVVNIHQHMNYLLVNQKTQNYIRTIKRIDSARKPVRAGSITDNDIACAKEVPISELYDGRLFGRIDQTGLCPFHKEETPSFHIKTEKNTWRCFGCGLYGDSIDFTMRLHNLKFIDAVKKLTK